ncbi:MAG TPA: hypothetical protein VMG10_01120 [Gemmataceae bacterium]|nr:hypothetical protein [Gemmataceae bacterium]
MRIKSVWEAGVLAALATLAVLAPGTSRAQESWPQGGFATGYAPPAVPLPYPLYNTHPENGGLFVAGSYVMYAETNPIQGQEIAVRGFVATDDSVLNAPGSAGTFVGPRNNALDAGQVSGPTVFRPGFQLEMGWKFGDGSALTATFWYIATAQYQAAATLAAPNYQYNSNASATFLTAYVFNFPSNFAGAPDKVTTGGPYSVYGIWNGASVMTESYRQWAEQFYMTYRKPFYETENYRASALVGPRWLRLSDKFQWITTDLTSVGTSAPQYVGVYNNIVTNNNYGLWGGLQQEWYLGWGLAAMLNINGGVFLDSVTTEVDYQTGVYGGPENKRGRRMWRPAAEAQITPSLMWYPLEGIQLQLAYDLFAVFNNMASPQPVDFNYSSLTPAYTEPVRFFQGFQVTAAFIF